MVLLGALLNGLEAFMGGVIGLLFKSHVSDDLGDFLLKGQGLCVVLVGVRGMTLGGSVVVVTAAMALGCLVGYLIDLDGLVRRLGNWAQRRLSTTFSGSERLGSFSEGFVAATLFCCTGAMAIVGSSIMPRSSRRASSTWWSAFLLPQPWAWACPSRG